MQPYNASRLCVQSLMYTHTMTAVHSCLLCVHGLLPITYKNNAYNIPVAVWVTTDYPRDPPLPYVVPTNDMLVKPGKYQDVSGRSNTEYLQNWQRKSEGCSLADLLDAMQLQFSKEPPVYAKPKDPSPPAVAAAPRLPPKPQQQPTPPPQHPPANPRLDPGPPQYRPSPPNYQAPPAQWSPPRDPRWSVQQPPPPPPPQFVQPPPPQFIQPPQSVQPPQLVQPPPPPPQFIQSPPPPPPPHLPAPNLLDEDAPPILHAPVAVAPGPPPPRPPNPELLRLHAHVHEKLSSELASLAHALTLDAERLRAHQADLLAGEPAIRDEMGRLEAVRDVCRTAAARMRGTVEDRRAQRRRPPPQEHPRGRRARLLPPRSCHNQLINLVAEDNAIEDTIFHLSKALNSGRIDLERFLRSCRILAEEQFMKRALIEKIQTGIPMGSSLHG
ncbi:UEV domain-containing protein [Mycena rebaudengoi]|nr:UEV domain-containing protein [Mycena rebaudengoi]